MGNRNPFEDDGGLFFVLINRVGRPIMWPVTLSHPEDWEVVLGPVTRHQAQAYLADHAAGGTGHTYRRAG